MNYNIIGYIAFFTIIYFVTIHIGWKFYKNGEVYIRMVLPDEIHLVKSINKLLLVGYYLLNLGYASISITVWPTLDNLTGVFNTIGKQAGFIILMLALMHYFNLFWLLMYGKYVERKKRLTADKINV